MFALMLLFINKISILTNLKINLFKMSTGNYRTYDIILSILLWGTLAILIISVSLIPKEPLCTVSIISFCIFAILYFYDAYTSTYFIALKNQIEINQIYPEIDRLIKLPPKITMHIECYHIETHQSHYKYRGRTRTRTVRVKVVTHTAQKEYKYSSWRDISGAFILDTSEAAIDEDVAFVKLNLKYNISFANDGTTADFAEERAKFKQENKKDAYQNYHEGFILEGFPEGFLVQVTDSPPLCFGIVFYWIWTAIGLNLLYTYYLDCHWHEQYYPVMKVVSSKQDLRAEGANKQYEYYNPRLIRRKTTVIFGEDKPQIVNTIPNNIIPNNNNKNLFIPVSYITEKIEEKKEDFDCTSDDETQNNANVTGATIGNGQVAPLTPVTYSQTNEQNLKS